jgi:hypothetical protein
MLIVRRVLLPAEGARFEMTLPAEGRLRVPALAAAIYPRTARPAWATSMSWV